MNILLFGKKEDETKKKIQNLEININNIAKILEINARNTKILLERVEQIEKEMSSVSDDIKGVLDDITYKPPKTKPSYIG